MVLKLSSWDNLLEASIDSCKMTERDFPDFKLGFYGRNESCSTPSESPPLLLEEARHLVYVFCDRDSSSKRGHKLRSRRTYCSLCRHFHKETNHDEGFEKCFVPETFKDRISERNTEFIKRKSPDFAAEKKRTDDWQRNERGGLETLTVQGLKMYKVCNKTNQNSLMGKEDFDSQKERKQNKKCFSARNGCASCEKRRNRLQQSPEGSAAANKRIIKVVIPSTDPKSHLPTH